MIQQHIELNRFVFSLFSLFFCLCAPLFQVVNAQERLIQVSGVIVTEDYEPVPGVAVVSKKLQRGSVSDFNGIYSITSTTGDTIYFRALGFKRYHTIIPESYTDRHATVDITLELDTIAIPEATILPWRTYSEFIADITKEKPVDPIIENMNENIASIYVAISNDSKITASPEASYYMANQQNFAAMRTRGQTPVNNLLNPLAWSKFISEMKRGLFRNHTYKKPTPAKVIKAKKKKKGSSNKDN